MPQGLLELFLRLGGDRVVPDLNKGTMSTCTSASMAGAWTYLVQDTLDCS